MIGTIKIHLNAAHPNLALQPLFAFVNSPSTLKIVDVPESVGDWRLTTLYVEINYPDNTQQTLSCTKVGNTYVCTLPASTDTGKSMLGYRVLADGIDENGLGVERYALGRGDVVILDVNGGRSGRKNLYVNLLEEEPERPNEGDMWPDEDGTYVIWQDGAANPLGITLDDVGDYVDPLLDLKADESELANYATNARVDGVDGDIDNLESSMSALASGVGDIQGLIPNQATTQNQLADKAFVNSSVQTATANFRGNWATWADVPTDASEYPQDYAGSRTPTVNDYMVVQDVTVDDKEGTWRYKYSGTWGIDGKNGWLAEYQVNETPLTAAQLAAINSGITEGLVSTFNAKQDALTTAQMSAINGEVSDRQTVIIYSNETSEAFMWTGTLSQQNLKQAGILSNDGRTWLKSPETVKIGTGVTAIDEAAFAYCTSLTNLTIAGSVESIGTSAFRECSNLRNVTLSEGIETIGHYAFYTCSAITGIVVPDSVTSIGSDAFEDCTSIVSAKLGTGLTTIGNHVFHGCTSLTSVTIPDSVTSIGHSAFYGCTGLTSVTIGNAITAIGDDAFRVCTSMTDLTIGDGVTSIGDYSFSGNTALLNVTIGSDITSIGYNAFFNCNAIANMTFRGKTRQSVSTMLQYPWGVSTSVIKSDLDVHSETVKTIVQLTQQQYEALVTKDANTLYVIMDN